MVTTHNLGFPRIGAKRELKFALENYWKGQSSRDELKALGAQLRQRHWEDQAASRLRARRRFRVLRSGARHELHARQPARARARFSWRCARQLFPCRARPLGPGRRRSCRVLRRRRGRRNDQVVRHQLSLHRPGVRREHAVQARSHAFHRATCASSCARREGQACHHRTRDVSVARQGEGRFGQARAVAAPSSCRTPRCSTTSRRKASSGYRSTSRCS